MSQLYEWIKASENLSNLPNDETELFVRYTDHQGVKHNAHGWIDTLDGERRMRWGRLGYNGQDGGYLIKFMKSLEWLSPVSTDWGKDFIKGTNGDYVFDRKVWEVIHAGEITLIHRRDLGSQRHSPDGASVVSK